MPVCRKPFFVITALSEQDGRSYWSAMRAPLLRQGCSRLPAAGSGLLPSVAAIDACSLMRGVSCQRMIFELAASWFWLMDDLDSSIRLNHGFVAGHFLHPGLLATDHEMRASSSMSSSGMGLETRAGWRVCGVSSLSSVGRLTSPGTARIRTAGCRALAPHAHQAASAARGRVAGLSLRLAMQIPAS